MMSLREGSLQTQVHKALQFHHITNGEFEDIMRKVKKIERKRVKLDRKELEIWKQIERKD